MHPTINIKFDQNENGVYFSGQVVSGKVEISFSKVKKVRGIAIKICGYAKAHWNERRSHVHTAGNTTRNRRSHYSGKEDYLSATSYLVGSDNATPTEILPGIHSYNFACALPALLPSSFEGTHGHIRYVAKVVLDRPWKFDQTYTVGFTVLKAVDLNYDSPLLRIPAEVEVIKKFWCGICTSKPLHIKACLPQTGFVPGQMIPIRTEINNASNMKVSSLRLYLRKVIIYRADTPTANSREEIVDLVCKETGYANPKSNTKIEENLIIPAVPPTSLFHSKVIQIQYDIKVEAVIPGTHLNPYVTCPITIGTVPLMTSCLLAQTPNQITITEPRSEPTSLYFQTKTDFGGSGAHSLPVIDPVYNREPTTPNFNIPPPSYEESVNMARARVDEDEEHSIQRNDFMPRYPVYNFQPSAPAEFEIAEDLIAASRNNNNRW